MDSQKLKKYIRSIVKEEVSSQLKTCLLEVALRNENSNVSNQKITYDTPSYDQEVVTEPRTKQTKIYTKNKLLNDVLNETTGGVPNNGSMVSLTENFYQPTPTNIPDSAPMEVKKVNNIINRDYSSILKAIEAKKQERLNK
jgi:hypothetical protein